MKSIYSVCVLFVLSFLAHANADDYILEVVTLEFMGDVPSGKTFESLLKTKSLPINSWKIEVSEGKEAIKDETEPYPFPAEISSQGVVTKTSEQRVGKKTEIKLAKIKGTTAPIEFVATEVKVRATNIVTVAGIQIAVPIFDRRGIEHSKLELEIGNWFIRPYGEKTNGLGMLTAIRLVKK